MRLPVFTLFFTLSSLCAFSQNLFNSCVKVYPSLENDSTVTLLERDAYTEAAFPTFNVRFERDIAVAIIENKVFQDVIVEIEVTPAYKDKEYKGINIYVKDSKKKKIYKNSFPRSYLYGYGDKSLQIGIDNVLLQMVIFKADNDQWVLFVRDRGIY